MIIDGAVLPIDSVVIPDATPDANPCPGLSFKPSNVSDCSAVSGDATDLHLSSGFYTLDTDQKTLSPAPPNSGSLGTLSVITQNDGVDILFIALGSLEIDSQATLHVTGSRALAFIVSGDVTIGGTIDGAGAGALAGPGSSSTVCTRSGSGGQGQDGPQDSLSGGNHNGYGGGAGGSFGGAVGGAGGPVFQGTTGAFAAAGSLDGNDTNAPLRGGCNGGAGGGNTNPTGGIAGGGGGALQLYSGGNMVINGTITAGGGGGTAASSGSAGGGGGGSGGAILLEGSTLTINTTAFITANGGGGGQGDRGQHGDSGADAHPKDATPALGGHANISGGPGGNGAAGTTAATAGLAGTMAGSTASGGGGGGGGVGRIRFRTPTGSTLESGSPLISPSPH